MLRDWSIEGFEMGIKDLVKKVLGKDEDQFTNAIDTDGCGDETPTWKKIMEKLKPC
jgi:hypothetical protein